MRQQMMVLKVERLKEDQHIDPFVFDPEDPLGVYKLEPYVPKHMEAIMQFAKSHNEQMKVVFSDGTSRLYHFKQVIINILFWRILSACGLPITAEDYHEFGNLDEGYLSKRFTAIYGKCKSVPFILENKVLSLMFEAVCNFSNFAHRYTWEYATSLSLDKLLKLMNIPEVKELRKINVNDPHNTKEVEDAVESQGKALVKLLIEKYPKEAISQMLAADTINKNQLWQMLVCYGPRSDINDQILGVPILHGTLEGLRSIREFLLEALSAKKSAVFNKSAVGLASYQNKKGLLTTCEIYHIYEGSCGNFMTRRFFLEDRNLAKKFIGKIIVEDGNDVVLTEENYEGYIGKVVNMVSALDCRHQYGICKRCIGAMADFIAKELHLGLATGAEVFSMIVQKILSSKHLTKTNTIQYVVTTSIKSWFLRKGNSFYLNNINRSWKLGFITSNIGKLESLDNATSVKESDFSQIKEIHIYSENDELIDIIEVEQKYHTPYLTTRFLNYLISVKDRIYHTNGITMVPLDKFHEGKPLFKVDNKTYDMNDYVNNVWGYLSKRLKNVHDPEEALTKFSNILFEKTDVNIFLAEVILKSLMIAGPNDYNLPLRHGEEPAYFGPIVEVISNRALTPKLVFEGVYSENQMKSFFNRPGTFLNPINIGNFAPFFNL